MATTFSLKQGETITSHGPIPHPLTTQLFGVVQLMKHRPNYSLGDCMILMGPAIVWYNVLPGYTCRTTVKLEQWKMVVNALSKMVKKPFFFVCRKQSKTKQNKKNQWKKLNKNFVKFRQYDFVQISLAFGKSIFKGMYGEAFVIPMSALATVVGKIFNGKFTAKVDFRSGILCYHCCCWHNKWKVSPYIIW